MQLLKFIELQILAEGRGRGTSRIVKIGLAYALVSKGSFYNGLRLYSFAWRYVSEIA